MVTRLAARLHICLACAFITGLAAAAPSYTLLALDNAPTNIPGENYHSIDSGFINSSSRVVFSGKSTGVDEFIAVGQPSAPQIVALQGTPAPGMPAGVTFSSLDYPHVSADGQIAFRATLNGNANQNDNLFGLWGGQPGQLQQIVKPFDIAPGTGGVHFAYEQFDDFDFSNNGVVTFTSTLTDNRTGIWSGPKGAIQAVALKDGPTPGVAGGIFTSFTSLSRPAANNSGKVVFQADFESPDSYPTGVWAGTPGNISLVTHEGMAAPGMGANMEVWEIWLPPEINHAGEVAFGATVIDNIEIEVYDVLYLQTSSGLQPIAVEGNAAPGFPAGSSLRTVSDFHLGGTQRASFWGLVTLPNNATSEGLFAYDNGVKRLVARRDQQIPGVAQDIRFSTISESFMNENGRVAFTATTTGVQSFEGLWVENEAGSLVEVARVGQQLEVAPGVFRTVNNLKIGHDFFGPENSRQPWNAAGQLVFHVKFGSDDALYLFDLNGASTLLGDFNHDGTVDAADYTVWRDGLGGAYDQSDYNDWKSHFGQSLGSGNASTSAVPEPTSAVLLLAAAALVSLRRR